MLPMMIKKVPVYALLKIRKRDYAKRLLKGSLLPILRHILRFEHVNKFKEFQTEEKHKKKTAAEERSGLSIVVTYHQVKKN